MYVFCVHMYSYMPVLVREKYSKNEMNPSEK